MLPSLTVGQLVHQLQTLDPGLPVRLAINPDWPFAHRIGRIVQQDEAAYIAENGQDGYLSQQVRTELGWD